MPTPEEIFVRSQMQKKLSSSSTVPYGSSANIPAPGSSDSSGPNTTTMVKSSSTAPEEEQKKQASGGRAPYRARGSRKTGVDQTKTLDTPKPFSEPYTPPTQVPYTYERVDPNDAMGEPVSQAPQEEPVMYDPHRSLWQAIFADDVPYGQKWHHYIQHGFVGVSPRNVQNVTALAATEGRPGAMSSTYGQELRAKEQKRRTLMDQWNKLLADWQAGTYASGDEGTVQAFYEEANRLRNELAAEGINPATLRKPSINPGGFARGFQKALQDDRNKLDWIGGWLNDIQQNVARSPDWLNSTQAQMYFDKLSEYTILNWAQSKGAIADAEKVRAQVEAMPAADRDVFDKFMNMFFSANTIAQLESMANRGSREAMSILEDAKRFVGLSERGTGAYGSVDENGEYRPSKEAEHYGNAALLGLKSLWRDRENNPIEINSAVTSYKNAREAYLQYTMQNANVDRKMVWDSAVGQYNIYKDMYNRKLPQLGLLWGWGHRGPAIDQNFGDYLKRWQDTQSPAEVMRRASLGAGHIPKPTADGVGGKGGRKGNAIPSHARWDAKTKTYVWKDRTTGKTMRAKR